MNRFTRGWAVLVLVGLAGCRAATPTAPAPPTGTPALPTSTLAPTDTPAPTGTGPVATLAPLEDRWEDRTVFRAGLIASEQAALDQLPGASIYHLEMEIADDMAGVQGQERVLYTNQEDEPLDALYFQLFPNNAGGTSTVSDLSVDGQAVEAVYEAKNSTVRVPLSSPLPPGKRAVIQLDFQVEIPTNIGGNYGLFGYLNEILVLDGFYPAIPVYDAQGWHAGSLPPNADTTFQDAAFYLVRVTAPATLTIVTTGVEVERISDAQHQITTFAAGPARDFYLAAGERLVATRRTVGETRINSYAFEENAAGARAALDVAAEALKGFNRRFGPYPYTEFDLVSTPMRGASGIEYPGIVGINRTLYDPEATLNGAPASELLESTVAHEVGHQWFYNDVGSDQNNEPWVDEAVTQYVTGLYYLDRYGEEGMMGYRRSWVERWKRIGRALIPVGLPAGGYENYEYGAIVYGRGPLFIEALAQKLGTGPFDAFLRDYYQTHRWGIATADEFKRLAEQHCACDLTPLFKEWVLPKLKNP